MPFDPRQQIGRKKWCGYRAVWLAVALFVLLDAIGLATAALVAAEEDVWDDRFGLSSIEYGSVRALTVHGTDLYIGGYFTSAGLLPANNVAHWDGQRWRALGRGISGTVNALAVYQDKLYAGGDFTQAGDVATNGIAVWDGMRWAALDGASGVIQDGYKGVVRALVATDDGLYIGGDFTRINGLTTFDIARWDGRQLTPLGEGLGSIDYYGTITSSGGVYALAAAPDGTLYAGGDFASAGNRELINVNSIARWDPALGKWEALGNGLAKAYGPGEVRAPGCR
jgi:hypothetical protein